MITTDAILAAGNVLIRAAVIIALTVSTIIVVRLAMKRFLWQMIRGTGTELDDRIFHLFESFLTMLILFLGMEAIVRDFMKYAGSSIQAVNYVFFLLYWTIGVYVSFRIISIVSNWYLSRVPLKERGAIDRRLIYSIRNIFMLLVSLFAVLILLDYFDITGTILNTMLAALGVGGIIVGLAAQTTLTNIIIGGALLIDRPFRIGDRIRVEQLDTWGDVIEIGWRSTRILTVDNRLVAIPNSLIGTGPVINYSIPEKIFRIETDVVVSYGPDIDYLKGLILDALEGEAWVMHERPVQVLLLKFTDYGMKLKVRCWIEDYVETRISEDRLNTAIYTALIGKRVAMPSSEMVIYFGDPEDKRIVSGRGE